MGPMFRMTWAEEFEIPYHKYAASASAHSSER